MDLADIKLVDDIVRSLLAGDRTVEEVKRCGCQYCLEALKRLDYPVEEARAPDLTQGEIAKVTRVIFEHIKYGRWESAWGWLRSSESAGNSAAMILKRLEPVLTNEEYERLITLGRSEESDIEVRCG